MSTIDRDDLASELATRIVAARVGAAAGRPNAQEARDCAAYMRIVLNEVRHGLGLPPVPEGEEE